MAFIQCRMTVDETPSTLVQRGINVLYSLGIFIPDMLSEFSYSESDDGLGGCTVVSFTFSVRLENARTKYRKWSLKLLLTLDTLC